MSFLFLSSTIGRPQSDHKVGGGDTIIDREYSMGQGNEVTFFSWVSHGKVDILWELSAAGSILLECSWDYLNGDICVRSVIHRYHSLQETSIFLHSYVSLLKFHIQCYRQVNQDNLVHLCFEYFQLISCLPVEVVRKSQSIAQLDLAMVGDKHHLDGIALIE